ncbi:MAG: hypothetical protein M3Y28_05690 [Armatimonadota bacterium]|nr:hypothetical protein [Armatimonadota bacterium]
MSNPPPSAERVCPNCGQAITPATILCPFCGVSTLESPVWAAPPPEALGRAKAAKGKIPLGVAASNVVAIGLVLLAFGLTSAARSGDAAGVLIGSVFILVPLVMGLVSAWFWRDLNLSTGSYFLYSLVDCALGLVLSAVFMAEGGICLLIVSPLLIVMVFGGALLGRTLFARNNNRLNLSLIPIALAVLAFDALSPHHARFAVADRIVIHAPPAVVWRHIAAFPPIPEKPDFRLFQMGLPYPVQSTIQGVYVGAERRCVFSQNLVFDERVTECEPNKKLTFDIVHQPDHPEILGHAAVKRGQFLLQDNGDGTTTLTGKSWYELYVYPSWYYRLWADDIARQVHWRVMNRVKTVCESPDGHV